MNASAKERPCSVIYPSRAVFVADIGHRPAIERSIKGHIGRLLADMLLVLVKRCCILGQATEMAMAHACTVQIQVIILHLITRRRRHAFPAAMNSKGNSSLRRCYASAGPEMPAQQRHKRYRILRAEKQKVRSTSAGSSRLPSTAGVEREGQMRTCPKEWCSQPCPAERR